VARALRNTALLGLILVVIVAALGLLFQERALGAIGSYLVQAEPPVKADIGVVLAGDARGNRILKAGELVKQGFIPRALVSGPDGNYGFHECDLAIPFAVKAGYPESSFVHFENNARSTEEEARVIIDEMRRQGAHSVLVVTNDYHTRRAGRMFRNAGAGLKITMVSAPDANFSAEGWWRNRDGRKTALMEWMKTVASWFGI
jgi:uncharacterized SAM-binding protein YcdF (DUF218 family)